MGVMISHSNFWGSLILTLRKEQKISQRQLAFAAKVNRATLRKLEEGQSSCTVEMLEAILSYLGYELEALEAKPADERLKAQVQTAADPARRSQLAANHILSARL